MVPVETDILAEAVAGRVMERMGPHLLALTDVQKKVAVLETKAEAQQDRDSHQASVWDYMKGNTLSTIAATLLCSLVLLIVQHIWK